MTQIHVIEDDTDMLLVIGTILQRQDFSTRLDSEPLKALEFLHSEQPDLIICDIDMPSISGYRLLQKVRQIEHLANTPFVFLSAHSDYPSIRKGMEAGADDYLVKPLQPGPLISAVKSLLHKFQLRAQGRSNWLQAQQELFYHRDQQIALMCHDLGNIFGCIEMISGLMNYQKDSLNEEMLDLLQDLSHQSGVGRHFLRNITLWLKERLQQEPIVLSPVSLVQACEAVQQNLERNIRGKGIRLTLQLVPELLVFANQDLVEAIVYNLVHNAAKYTPRGGQITLRAEAQGDWAQIHVIDTGAGMTKKQLGQLFHFTTRSRVGIHGEEGRGIGLILCQEMAKQMGGSLRAESTQGHGSQFSLLLKQSTPLTVLEQGL